MRDASKDKRTDKALQECQTLLATTERVAEIGSWRWDVVHDVALFSEELCRILGLPPPTRTWTLEDSMVSVHADDKARVRRALDAALAGETPYDVDFRVVRADGTERWLNSRGQVFRGKGGKPIRMIGTTQDITARKRLEETSYQSEARYRTLFEASPDAVVMWDAEGVIREANARAVTLLGYDKVEDVIGTHWENFIAPEDRGITAEPIRRAGDGGSVAEDVFKMQRRDGSTFFAQGRAVPILDAAGKPISFIGAVRDVSEQKRTLEALRNTGEMLQNAESIAQIGSWQWDVETNIHTWSAAQYRLLGLTPAASPRTFEDLLACVHPADRQRVRDDAIAAVSSGKADDLEFRIVRPDGVERIVSARKQVYLNDEGRPVRVVGTMHDVTELRRHERELAQLHTDLLMTVGKLEQRQRDMVLLNELNETMQTCNSRDEAYPVIAATAQELFPKGNGALAMSVNHGRDLKTRVEWGSGQWMASDFLLDDCWALRRGQPHDVDHPGQGALCHHFKSPPAGPYLCLPLVVHGEMLGLLHFSVAADDRIDADLRGLLTMFSEIVKLALSNLGLRVGLRDQAIHDHLTGLFNRQYLEETLAREVHRARRQKAPLSVAMLDVDHFKLFNDNHGHEAGDQVLRALGELLRAGVRESDIACRYGGEEFLLVFLDTDMATALKRLRGICRDIKRKRFACRGKPLPGVTVSVGLAQLPLQGATTPEKLLKASDDALYAAKNNGRDRIEIFSAPRSEKPAPDSPS